MSLGGIGAELHFVAVSIVEPRFGCGVPEYSVAVGRNQQGNGDIGVRLRQFDDGAPIIENTTLVLAQPIERFLHWRAEPITYSVERFSICIDVPIAAGGYMRLLLRLL